MRLLTEPERILLRKLAVFIRGSTWTAAQMVTGDDEVASLSRSGYVDAAGRQVAGGGRNRKRPNAVSPARRRSVSTRKKSSVSPVRPMRCVSVTASITLRWQRSSMFRGCSLGLACRRHRDRVRQSAGRVSLEPQQRRRPEGAGSGVVADATVVDAGPDPARTGLVRHDSERRESQPRHHARRAGARRWPTLPP